MPVNYYLKENSDFKILNYQIKYQPKQFYHEVIADFEVGGDYQLPYGSLTADLLVNSQQEKGLQLLETPQTCHFKPQNTTTPCRVYRLESKLAIKDNKFLQSKITNQMIPIGFRFNINFDKLKSLDWNTTHFYDHDYRRFISIIQNTTINRYFPFTNNYFVRHKATNQDQEQIINLVTTYYLKKDQSLHYETYPLIFQTSSWLNQKDQPIKQLLKIINPKQQNLNITNLKTTFHTYLENQKTLLQPTIDYDQHTIIADDNQNQTITYHGSSSWANNQLQLSQQGPVQGFFVPLKAKGQITTELNLKLNQTSVLINWSNDFAFHKNFLWTNHSAIEYQTSEFDLDQLSQLGDYQVIAVQKWE